MRTLFGAIGRGRWWREPLLHFVVLGAVLWALLRWTEPQPPERIVISEGRIIELVKAHASRTGTPPTEEQQRAMVEQLVDEEVLYREALALGLDRGDSIVRLRLIQKMQFLTNDMEPLPEPTDDELAAYLESRVHRYRFPTRVTMTHVFAARERHGRDAEGLAARWREELAAGAAPTAIGDLFVRGGEFRLRTERELAGVFGPRFAANVMSLPAGVWSGPLRSSFGWHAVLVAEKVEARAPALSEVRDAVRRDWEAERRAKANRVALDRLRQRYEVQVEWPGGTSSPNQTVASQ